MTITAPDRAATGFYNELVGLDPESMIRATEIEWSVRSLLRRDGSDAETLVVLIQALLQQGKAREAGDVAEAVWHRRDSLQAQALDTFGAQLCDLGQYERSGEISTSDLLGPAEFASRARIIAFNSGDLDRFEDLATPWQANVVAELRRGGFDALFPETQQAIRDALVGTQVHTDLQIVPGDEEDTIPGIARRVYTALPYQERSDLEFSIYERLDVIYTARGLDLATAWRLAGPMVMPVGSLSSHKRS